MVSFFPQHSFIFFSTMYRQIVPLAFLLVVFLTMIVNTAVYHKPLHVPVSTVSSLSKKVPLPTKNSNLSDPLFDHHIQAIVYIASARYADRLLTLLAIRSARTIGNWKKEIFVLTDMRRCFSGEEVTPISVISEVDSSDSMKSKRFKAKIFEYLPSHIRRVLYLDADIIIGRDLTEFDRLSAELSKEHPDAHMFCYPEMDSPPQAVRETHHSGIMIIDRMQSQPCLKLWSEAFGKYERDQTPLALLVADGKCDIPFLSYGEMVKPDGGDKTGLFNHLTEYRLHMYPKEYLTGWLYKVLGEPSPQQYRQYYRDFIPRFSQKSNTELSDQTSMARLMAAEMFRTITTRENPCTSAQ